MNSETLFQLCEVTPKYKITGTPIEPAITSSSGAVELLRGFFDPDTIAYREEFWVIYLSNANKVVAVSRISTGGITATLVDMRILFTQALITGSTAIILAHNHPSGKLFPSFSDETLTSKAVNAGKMLDIKVLDHVILTPKSYMSFADEGKMPG